VRWSSTVENDVKETNGRDDSARIDSGEGFMYLPICSDALTVCSGGF
jgi:hypothetical protein